MDFSTGRVCRTVFSFFTIAVDAGHDSVSTISRAINFKTFPIVAFQINDELCRRILV